MSTVRETISLQAARRIALRAQGLADADAPYGPGKEAALKAVEHLGYIQIDTISVVERAHHHVLWSRVPDYKPEMLHELHEKDREVFEYWNHAASYLPMRDFRFSLPPMKRYRSEEPWSEDPAETKKARRRMLQLIKKNGPLLLREIESKKLIESWWNAPPSKIEKRALHQLWMGGQVMVRQRQRFQKVFDLPERVLPNTIDQTMPSKREEAEFHVRRALRALGLARASELHYLQDSGLGKLVKAVLSALVKRGEILELRVEGSEDVPCYAFPGALKLAAPLKERRLHILSPFDNLVIQRQRLRWLFDFDYLIECYVPGPKRRFGYFVLPILWGEEFIGRMDAKADRAKSKLLIQNFVFEERFKDFQGLRKQWDEAFGRFMKFQGCKEFEVVKVGPASRKSFFTR